MKRLSLHDTLTRECQEVFPSDGEVFRFYCCGPTVYGPAHIGNFRTFLVQDLLRRVVELSGLKTRHVRNVTDVDDKTIRESQAAGVALPAFAAGWTARFHEDADALNMLQPHVEPGAVDHIPEQIVLIENLLARGNAYHSEDGSVYFKVSSFAPYGRLSRLDKRELKAGAAESANDADEYDKDNVSDFVLWKTRKPADGENFWESPWGEGRPGWHLECSAMGMKYLGESFDLHAGGVDLCFPHHENEIAQSRCAHGTPVMAKTWMHNGFLQVEGDDPSGGADEAGEKEGIVPVACRGIDNMIARTCCRTHALMRSLRYPHGCKATPRGHAHPNPPRFRFPRTNARPDARQPPGHRGLPSNRAH